MTAKDICDEQLEVNAKYKVTTNGDKRTKRVFKVRVIENFKNHILVENIGIKDRYKECISKADLYSNYVLVERI